MEITYIGHDGAPWVLASDGPVGAVGLESGGVEGLVGRFTDGPVSVVGVPGQSVNFRNRVVEPITGVLGVVVEDGQMLRAFLRSWSPWRWGRLKLMLGGRVFALDVRLSEVLEFPEHRPEGLMRVRVPVVADRGVWEVWHDAAGRVTVTNWGDVTVWPSIEWEGAGGEVTLPSGASFVLPAASQRRVMSLSRLSPGVVTDVSGVVDRELGRKVQGWAEGVPRGESGVYVLPGGARLRWPVGVFNPWSVS